MSRQPATALCAREVSWPRMDEWLTAARERVAEAAGLDPSSLDLTQAEVDEILELARVAAHESGERIHAPLLCYLVGLAQGRRGGDLAALVDAAVGKAEGGLPRTRDPSARAQVFALFAFLWCTTGRNDGGND